MRDQREDIGGRSAAVKVGTLHEGRRKGNDIFEHFQAL